MPTALALAAALVSAQPGLASPTGISRDVVFTEYPAAADASELVRRLGTPLAGVEVARVLASQGKTLEEHSVDLTQERFLVYAPPQAPPGGYGLLVFVPPWDEARLPEGWAGVLDRAGMIFVTAARSGNAANTVGRREPLALIALANIAKRYRLDPARIFVSGFSGGSRVAERLALGFPDLFRGAVLDAGADPIGDAGAPLPPRDLFERFQAESRLVLVSGERDSVNLTTDVGAAAAMRRWCVQSVETDQTPNAGHQIADAGTLSRVLNAVQKPPRTDPAKLNACRATIASDLARNLAQARDLAEAGQSEAARKLLIRIDGRFGGLAAPDSVALSARLPAR